MRINKLFDYADFSDPDFIKVQKAIYEAGGDRRKTWEFVIMAYGIEQLVSEDSVALGLGCLHENLIYVFANKFKHTYATDVAYYPKDHPKLQKWGEEAYAVKDVYNTDIPYDETKLTVLPMDMMQIEFPDSTFDVVWCSSSVEHVGELPEVIKVFKEVDRVLKPNGIFSITSEWNLNYQTTQAVKFANVQTFDYFVLGEIEKAVPNLKLVEPLSLERSNHPKNFEKDYMLGKTNNYYGDEIDYTSVSLFWRKI